MNDQKEFLVQQKFVQEYFKNIAELNSGALKSYLQKTVKEHVKKEKEEYDVATLLNQTKEGNGKKALHFAASRGDVEIFKLLLSEGADINVQDDHQNTVLFIAVEHQRKELIEFLLQEKNIDVNQKRGTITVLHQAAQSGDIPIVDLLLQYGADINAESQYGTPIMFAAAQRHNWLCLHLLKKGANPNKTSQTMPPVLHLVIDQNNKELFEILTKEYREILDVNIKDQGGWSALQLAAEHGNVEVLKVLMELGADVDYENEGQTSLDVSVQHNRMDCAELLRERARRKEAQALPQQFEKEVLTPDQKQERLDKAMEIKNIGNDLFKNQQFKDALQHYQEAFQITEPIRNDFPDQVVAICTNIATCFKELKQPQEMLNICNIARTINPKWIKIYFLEGNAYEQLQDYGEAAVSYFDAMKIESSPLFKKLFDDAIAKGKASYKEKQQKQAAGK